MIDMMDDRVIDKLAQCAAEEYDRYPPFDELRPEQKEGWRRVVRTVLAEATDMFLNLKV
jgi:hypothetical protein